MIWRQNRHNQLALGAKVYVVISAVILALCYFHLSEIWNEKLSLCSLVWLYENESQETNWYTLLLLLLVIIPWTENYETAVNEAETMYLASGLWSWQCFLAFGASVSAIAGFWSLWNVSINIRCIYSLISILSHLSPSLYLFQAFFLP